MDVFVPNQNQQIYERNTYKIQEAVADSTDLQEKVKAGADLVALGKENGFEFTQEELETGWEELQRIRRRAD